MGAALAIAGGIFILHFKNNSDYLTAIKRKIDALGPPDKDPSGKVTFEFLKSVYLIADKIAYERLAPLK